MTEKWRDMAEILYRSPKYRQIITPDEWDILRNGDEPYLTKRAHETLIRIEERYLNQYGEEPEYDDPFEFGADENDRRHREKDTGIRIRLNPADAAYPQIRTDEAERLELELYRSIHRSTISGDYEYGTDAWRAWCKQASPREIRDMVAFDVRDCEFIENFERFAPEDRRRLIKARETDKAILETIRPVHDIRMEYKRWLDISIATDPANSFIRFAPYALLTVTESITHSVAGLVMLGDPRRLKAYIRYYGRYPLDFPGAALSFIADVVNGVISQFYEDPDLLVADLFTAWLTGGSKSAGKTTSGVVKKQLKDSLERRTDTAIMDAIDSELKRMGKSWDDPIAVHEAQMTKTVRSAIDTALDELEGGYKYIDDMERKVTKYIGYDDTIENWIKSKTLPGRKIDWETFVEGEKGGKYRRLDEITAGERISIFSPRGIRIQFEDFKQWIKPRRGEFEIYLMERGDVAKRIRKEQGYFAIIRDYKDWREGWRARSAGDPVDIVKKESLTTRLGDLKRDLVGPEAVYHRWNFDTARDWFEYNLYIKKRRYLRKKGDPTRDIWVPKTEGRGYTPNARPDRLIDVEVGRVGPAGTQGIKLRYYDGTLKRETSTFFESRGRGRNEVMQEAKDWWKTFYRDTDEIQRLRNTVIETDKVTWELYKNYTRIKRGERWYIKPNFRYRAKMGRKRGTHIAVDPRTGEVHEVIELTMLKPEAKSIIFKRVPEIPYLFPIQTLIWDQVSLNTLLRIKRYIYYMAVGANSYNIINPHERINVFGEKMLEDEFTLYEMIFGEYAPYRDTEGNPVNPLDTPLGRWLPANRIWKPEDFLYWMRQEERWKDTERDDFWSLGTGVDNAVKGIVKRVVDGDTFDIEFPDHRVQRVRLLGVDTPETHDPANRSGKAGKFSRMEGMQEKDYLYYWGMTATIVVRQLIEGKEVRVVYDTNTGMTGGFGRILAHIYYQEGGEWKNLAEFLLTRGYARIYPEGKNEGQEEYFQMMIQAAEEGRGVWILADTESNEWADFIDRIAGNLAHNVVANQLGTIPDEIESIAYRPII